MRSAKKRVAFLLLVTVLLLVVAMLASCGGFDGTVESFLKAKNYTVETQGGTLKVDGAAVYLSTSEVDTYLYYDKAEGSYFYCTITKEDDSVSKLAIDSEEYINYRSSITYIGSTAASLLKSFMQIKGQLEGDGQYELTIDGAKLTVSATDSEILYKFEAEEAENSYFYKAYDVNKTTVEIPDSVNSAKVIE